MPMTSELAGTEFATMNPAQAAAALRQRFANIGPLAAYAPTPVGTRDSDTRPEDVSPHYGNDKLAGLEDRGGGRFYGPLTMPFDSQIEGGKYGQYFGTFDREGNLDPNSVTFAPVERDNGWLSNHMREVTLATMAAGAAFGSGMFGGAGAAAPTGLDSISLAEAGLGGGGTGVAAPITNLSTMAPAADIARLAASGTPLSTLAPQILRLGSAGISALKALLPSGLANAVDGIVDSVGGGNGLLSNGLNVAAGLTQLDGLRNASNTAADSFNNLADKTTGDYQFLGDKAQGMFGQLGDKGQNAYENLGMRVGDTYNTFANNTETKYNDLATKVKTDVGTFRPYNITTNVGTSDPTGFRLGADIQGVNDSATQAATSSFKAANDIDVNKLAEQRYGLMQQVFAPGDAASLAELRSNRQARGRDGIQSLNPAYSVNGQGAAPEDVAYFKAMQDRNLKAQATAADQALAQRGGLLSQGAGAANVPLQYGQQGLNQFNSGVNAGSTAFNAGLQGSNASNGIALRGLDQGTNITQNGINAVGGLFDKGIGFNLGAQREGINSNLDLGTRAISSGTTLRLNAIGQRYQGNLAATNALFSLLSALAKQTGTAAPQQTGNATDYMQQMMQRLLSNGMSESDANRVIQQVVQSQIEPGNPFTSNDYGDNVSTVDSIWTPFTD